VIPLYISELAPAKYRGRMISFSNLSVTFGQLLASTIGAGFAQVGGENFQVWRETVGIRAIPTIIPAGLLTMCLEFPRQLVAHGRKDEASATLIRIFPTSSEEQRRVKILSIEMSIKEATVAMVDGPVWKTFVRTFTTSSTFCAIFVACTIVAISQLSRFNTLMYYSATLFRIVGFSNATAVAITVSETNFVLSIVNLIIVDTFGRRRILLFTIAGMTVCLLIAAVSLSFIPINLEIPEVKSNEIGWSGIILVVRIIAFVGCYSSGVATVAWVGTELIPIEYRAVGTMLNTVTCWSTNIIIASTFLSMMKGITSSGAFGFYYGICFLGWLFVIFCFAEVRGMRLGSISLRIWCSICTQVAMGEQRVFKY
jgi:SP family myo-inositol transporter-like MFS transporter 13